LKIGLIVKRLFLSVFIALQFAILPATGAPITSTGSVEVFFSPNGGATEDVVREIGKARQEVLVQAYSFTSKPIAKALLDAHKRGVKVMAVLDKSQRKEKYTGATFLAHAGIPVYIDGQHAIAHNKVMVLDRSTLITGSFNFTKAAEEKNAENLLVIKGNPALVEKYLKNFEEHKAHSERYAGTM
jgi:phosphatidylserine/phosphatidylglycerophosphate/cardiolipin synthase-like enzyme